MIRKAKKVLEMLVIHRRLILGFKKKNYKNKLKACHTEHEGSLENGNIITC